MYIINLVLNKKVFVYIIKKLINKNVFFIGILYFFFIMVVIILSFLVVVFVLKVNFIFILVNVLL